MAQRSSGGGSLDRIMKRLGSIGRFQKLGTPAPGRNLPQEGASPTNQPRPPAAPLARPQAPAQSGGAGQQRPQPAPPGQDVELPVGMQLQLPEGAVPPGMGGTPINPPMTAPTPLAAGDVTTALAGVTEGPAVQYFRRYGIVPNFLSLQVISSGQRLAKQLGRPPTRREILKDISQRDISGGSGAPGI